MGSVYRLTLRQLSGRWRLAIMTVLAALPVLITLITLGSDEAPSIWDFETAILSAMLAGSILPLVVLAIGGAAFGNEVEDRTLANLTLAPIPRWRIALPKLLAVITIAGPFIAASALLTAHIAFLGDIRATAAVTLSALAGVAMYASVFLFLGLISTHAVGIGLLYIVIWEGFFAGFVSGARLLSIRYHAIAIMHALDPRRFALADDTLPAIAAVLAAVLVTGGFLLLSIRRLRRMDVP
ncbi:MAG TPA: ABC transporter permease [Gemmatimonadales bacterium]|nr:ABC transporter permease [Gemmatimonadales bacterium]